MDTTEIKELTEEDFKKARKNPYAKKLRENGYSIIIHVSPDDISESTKDNLDRINFLETGGWLDLDVEEIQALKKYREANTNA